MKIRYCKTQLDRAVDFLCSVQASSNKSSILEIDRSSFYDFFHDLARNLVKDEEVFWVSSGGFTLVACREDHTDVIDIEITVIPDYMHHDYKPKELDV